MKAWVLSKNGIENLSFLELETPKPGPEQVLLKVKAVGLNPIDSMVVDMIPVSSPKVPGAEFAGEVYEVGEKVKNFKKGDRVTVYNRYFDGTCRYCINGDQMLCDNGYILGVMSNGGMAEYAVVDAKNLFNLPDSVDFLVGASLPVAAITSYNAIIRANLKKGETIVVLGAGGNTGMFALQLSKEIGANVIAVSNKFWLKDFGADYIFDFDSVLDKVKDITKGAMADVVINSLGEKFWDIGYSLLGKKGRLVSFGTENGSTAKIDISQLYSKELSIIGSTGGSIEQFSELVKNSANLKVRVWKKFGLEELKEAFEANKDNKKQGRVMLSF
jgi:NADPH:quinone reductase-like Zn-dependent oxidoreductase